MLLAEPEVEGEERESLREECRGDSSPDLIRTESTGSWTNVVKNRPSAFSLQKGNPSRFLRLQNVVEDAYPSCDHSLLTHLKQSLQPNLSL